jgi:hypothetical protein
MSGIFNMLSGLSGGASQASGTNILLQAVGAALRGESAQDFMKNLASTDPRLKGVNMNDLYGSAQQLAKEQGKDINALTKEVENAIAPIANK